MNKSCFNKKLWGLIGLLLLPIYVAPAYAVLLNLSDSPLLLTQTAPPLAMMIIERDHKLFMGAYNNTTDLNGDGTVELTYTPQVDYYGYFDSHKCYQYSNGTFIPVSVTTTKKCTNAWSGDWLNWVTMSRIDLLRKALYGGDRSNQDTPNLTILSRANIPQDGHSFGQEYRSLTVDGYSISDYTPLVQPSGGRHLFVNTTLLNNTDNKNFIVNQPLLRVLTNQTARIWDWIGKSFPVAGQTLATGTTVVPTDYIVRVKVCDPSVGLESNCKIYPNGSYKPTGLVQEYGENVTMKFGLFTGTYNNNIRGGVLRKNVEDLSNEISFNNGQFTSSGIGLIQAINRLAIPDFNANYTYKDGYIFNRRLNSGEFQAWGNPIAEIFHEALRYYAGKITPTTHFTYSGGTDTALALPNPKWIDPYAPDQNPVCAKPNILIVSDIYPDYDSDEVPGSFFKSYPSDLTPAINVTSLGDTIYNGEFGSSSSQHFIGQSGSTYDGAPTAKTITSLGNIRGLAPEQPSKEGSYYTASLAYHAWVNDINPASGDQNVHTFVLALGSPSPEIKVQAGSRTISFVPFAKTIGKASSSCINLTSIDPTKGAFQPTNQVISYFIQQLTPTSGQFLVNFNDLEQGGNYDTTTAVVYSYQVNADSTVTLSVSVSNSSDCLVKHIGYAISGTTADGPYLVVRDATTYTDIPYFLDKPVVPYPLPLTDTRTFTPGSSSAATLLKDPLYFAAKWGSFKDLNNNNKPDLIDEWAKNNGVTPDNYFLVSNPLSLSQQLVAALENILARSSSAASAAVNSASLSSLSRLYQVLFNSADWSGQILSFPIKADGTLNTSGTGPNGSEWDAGLKITAQGTNRQIISYNPKSRLGIAFKWPSNPAVPTNSELTLEQVQTLNTNSDTNVLDGLGSNRLSYLHGDRSKEKSKGGTFRNRNVTLGDIINSAPMFVGSPSAPYSDAWPSGAPENAVPYSTFKANNKNRTQMLYVGANDGLLHGINATTGDEKLGYVPSKIYFIRQADNTILPLLNQLTSLNYVTQHRYYVDGAPNVSDVFYSGGWHTVLVAGLNKGGQGVFALDVTDPSAFAEINAKSIVLWEFTDTNTASTTNPANGDPDLGYVYGQPAIVRMTNGKWAAIFGNGYNNTLTDGSSTSGTPFYSTTGNAVLYIVDIETGTLIKKLDTGVGSAADPLATGRPNGLATPAVVSVNGDNIATYIYAGDLFGNLWKFDVSDASASNWKISFAGQPLFVAQDATGKRQPITSRPTVTALPPNKLQVFFGTGKFIETTDKGNLDIQTFYSIIDGNNAPVVGRSVLLQQQILAEISLNGTQKVRVTSNNTPLPSTALGWYMDLVQPPNATQQGERVVSNPIVRNKRVIFVTMIPSADVCSFGGTGWLMELDAKTGARLTDSPFDLSGDLQFTAADFVNYTVNGQTTAVPASGIQSQVGVIPTPGILSTSTGELEYKYAPGSSGKIGITVENPGSNTIGRQSWKQTQ